MSEEDSVDNRAEKEYELLNQAVNDILNYVQNIYPFHCIDIKLRIEENDIMKKENQDILNDKLLFEY